MPDQFEKEREESLEQTVAALAAITSNEDGFRRLEAISDEEWDAALAESLLDDEAE